MFSGCFGLGVCAYMYSFWDRLGRRFGLMLGSNRVFILLLGAVLRRLGVILECPGRSGICDGCRQNQAPTIRSTTRLDFRYARLCSFAVFSDVSTHCRPRFVLCCISRFAYCYCLTFFSFSFSPYVSPSVCMFCISCVSVLGFLE